MYLLSSVHLAWYEEALDGRTGPLTSSRLHSLLFACSELTDGDAFSFAALRTPGTFVWTNPACVSCTPASGVLSGIDFRTHKPHTWASDQEDTHHVMRMLVGIRYFAGGLPTDLEFSRLGPISLHQVLVSVHRVVDAICAEMCNDHTLPLPTDQMTAAERMSHSPSAAPTPPHMGSSVKVLTHPSHAALPRPQ